MSPRNGQGWALGAPLPPTGMRESYSLLVLQENLQSMLPHYLRKQWHCIAREDCPYIVTLTMITDALPSPFSFRYEALSKLDYWANAATSTAVLGLDNTSSYTTAVLRGTIVNRTKYC